MDEKVLVTYASKYGATAEIAEKIGEVLRQAGLQTDILPVKSIRDLTQYNAVILGSAVYIGQWRKDAVKFLKASKLPPPKAVALAYCAWKARSCFGS